MEQVLNTSRDDKHRNCGIGVKVVPKAKPQVCSYHAYSCWLRHNPVSIAKAAALLKFIGENGHAYTDEKPTPELIEVARQLMLARGYQLEYEEGELGAPDHYSPSPELKEQVRRKLLEEDYDLRDEVARCIPAPLHGPMGESIGR
jgi:hypothetical protein